MFSLIIVIISIALVGALLAAALWYGGQAYTDATTSAAATRLINEGMQVKAAVDAHKMAHRTGVENLQDLVDRQYLSAVPSSAWGSNAGYAVASNVNQQACLIANKSLGIHGIPHCDDPRIAKLTICCTTEVDGVVSEPGP